MKWALVCVALAVLAVAAVSRRLSGTPVTPAMAFLLIGVLVGPAVTDGVDLSPSGAAVRTLAEATLAVVLFADASRIKPSALRREYTVPLRLLAIGLPLTIALGAVLAAACFGQLTLAEGLVLAVLLAPTDAALGQAVVTEPRLPSRIRQGLNVESGLNDGICVPLLFIVLATAEVDSNVSGGHSALTIVFEEIGYGLLGGLAAGLLVSAVVVVAGRRGLITGSWLRIVPVAGAALAYGLATALGGSGFIAAFLAGALVVEESHLPHVNTILLTTYTTVGLSVLAHGATAAPLADLYARWYASRARDQLPPMESVDAAAHRVRGAGFAAEHGAP